MWILVYLQSPTLETEWREEMRCALEELLALLKDEHTMSAYELHSSGLVQALFNCLNVSALASPAIVCFCQVILLAVRSKNLPGCKSVCLYFICVGVVSQNNDEPSSKISRKHALERINLFRDCFKDPEDG